MDRRTHWERIYRSRDPSDLSWYQPEARLSVDLIRRVAPDLDASIIDVGGGASALVDGLLAAGYRSVTVLDLAGGALAHARARLGPAAAGVNWIEADVLEAPLPPAKYTIWHDRAVFHFLIDSAERARYVAQVRHAVRPGGHVLVASFSSDGPARCSGLDVARYTPEGLHAEFGPSFRLLDSIQEMHRTPGGTTQAFVYCLCRIEGAARASEAAPATAE